MTAADQYQYGFRSSFCCCIRKVLLPHEHAAHLHVNVRVIRNAQSRAGGIFFYTCECKFYFPPLALLPYWKMSLFRKVSVRSFRMFLVHFFSCLKRRMRHLKKIGSLIHFPTMQNLNLWFFYDVRMLGDFGAAFPIPRNLSSSINSLA